MGPLSQESVHGVGLLRTLSNPVHQLWELHYALVFTATELPYLKIQFSSVARIFATSLSDSGDWTELLFPSH